MINIKNNILTFIGISLANCSSSGSGVCVLDSSANIIFLDKLFTLEEIENFIYNVQNKKNTVIFISLVKDFTILNAKWKLNTKKTRLIDLNQLNSDRSWDYKFSNRGSEIFSNFLNDSYNIFRFDINKLRMSLNLYFAYQTHCSSDCKFLQNAIKTHLGFCELPNNLLPINQLEAILGAYLGYLIFKKNMEYKIDGSFYNLNILSLI